MCTYTYIGMSIVAVILHCIPRPVCCIVVDTPRTATICPFRMERICSTSRFESLSKSMHRPIQVTENDMHHLTCHGHIHIPICIKMATYRLIWKFPYESICCNFCTYCPIYGHGKLGEVHQYRLCMYVCMYVCTCVRMYVRTYVCMFVCMCVCTFV